MGSPCWVDFVSDFNRNEDSLCTFPSGWRQAFAMGSPVSGRVALFCALDRNEGPHASVCGVSAPPALQGVLPGPRCVRELRFSLAPSSVLHCPVLWFSVASTTLAAGLGLSWVPCPAFCQLGFCSSVGGSACALQPLAPSYRLVLTEAAGLGGFLVLSIVLP